MTNKLNEKFSEFCEFCEAYFTVHKECVPMVALLNSNSREQIVFDLPLELLNLPDHAISRMAIRALVGSVAEKVGADTVFFVAEVWMVARLEPEEQAFCLGDERVSEQKDKTECLLFSYETKLGDAGGLVKSIHRNSDGSVSLKNHSTFNDDNAELVQCYSAFSPFFKGVTH